MARRLALTLAIAAIAVPSIITAQSVDDRDLLRSRGAKPNVLVIMDSSGSMARDLDTDSYVFIGGGEDPHAKLSQVKFAFQRFLETNPEFNLGFTFYERENLRMDHHLFIYRVHPEQEDLSWRWRVLIDEDGDVSFQSSTTTMSFDANTLVRLGLNDPANSSSGYAFPPRFGAVGKLVYADWSRNSDYANSSTITVNGSTYTGEYRVDGYLHEPMNDTGYYFPAWDWSSAVQTAIGTFNAIHDYYAPTVYDPYATPEEKLYAWYSLVEGREDLQGVLNDHQIGRPVLNLVVHVRRCTGWIRDTTGVCNDGVWEDVVTHTRQLLTAHGLSPSDLDQDDTTAGTYAAKTIPQDYVNGNSRTAYLYSDSCDGFQGYSVDGTRQPIIPIPTDDDPPLTSVMYRYLNDQGQMQLFFPTRPGRKYWPYYFESQTTSPSFDERGVWITDRAVMGCGNTPIAQSLYRARLYFSNIINHREDSLRDCRKDFIILLTDGLHTCSSPNPTNVCDQATYLGNIDVPVYVIGYGMGTSGNTLECIADNSNGELYLPSNVEELVEALRNVGAQIEERTRGFASPIVPSVETTAEQTAYIATFTPQQERSVWRGHLRAYEIDPATGSIRDLPVSGIPVASTALWDVGDVLAARNLSTDDRFIYFGKPNGTNVPAVRDVLAYSSTDETKRDYMGDRIFYPELYEDTTEDRAELRQVIDFIRGVMMERDSDGDVTVPGRDPEQYGWCGPTYDESPENPLDPCTSPQRVEKLGDIFHSKPKLVGKPECFACWLRNYKGYRDDTSTTDDTADGFYTRQKRRRQVLYVGANDGTLHAIDAGMWDPDGDTSASPRLDPGFDRGTGRELFAWVPQGVFTTLDDIATDSNHEWTVDGAPTVADVFIDPVHSGTPNASQREWRTVLLFGERRGGRSLVALDVTQPDKDINDDFVPDSPATGDVSGTLSPADTGRDPTCRAGGTGCEGVWPAFMWELTDTSDEDGNTAPDLAQTWSQPLVSFVRVTTDSNTSQDRMMAFFGGGYDPLGLSVQNPSGNFIYGVDVETGHILFKRDVIGQVPGQPAGIDADLDGFIEVLYWGTTAGKIYRMDISKPGLISTTAQGDRIAATTVEGTVYWQPRILFDAGANQPFFMRPTLVPISFSASGMIEIAVAIGSGNRANIFEHPSVQHRFYVFADRPTSDGSAITESDLEPILPSSDTQTANYLLDPSSYGWYLYLIAPPDGSLGTPSYEKTNTPAVILEQYVIFSTFTPTEDVITEDVHADPNDPNSEVIGTVCRLGGGARTYRMFLFNGNPPQGEERYVVHPGGAAMATEPVLYIGADGKIHVIQALDNLRLDEPVAPMNVPVRITSWKEE